jgi:prepilin-type processing-associated H-X9-DG protein
MWSTTKLSFLRANCLWCDGRAQPRFREPISFRTNSPGGNFTDWETYPSPRFEIRCPNGINIACDDARHFPNEFAFQYTNASSPLTAPFTTNPSIMGSLQVDESSFDAPPQVHSFLGILLDFDGTIIDSTDAIVKHWHK